MSIEIPLVGLHATVANVAVAALSRMLRSRTSVPGGDMAGSKLVGSGEKRLAARASTPHQRDDRYPWFRVQGSGGPEALNSGQF